MQLRLEPSHLLAVEVHGILAVLAKGSNGVVPSHQLPLRVGPCQVAAQLRLGGLWPLLPETACIHKYTTGSTHV